MTHRLKIYLAGPIRGCSPEQCTWWREEAKQILKKDFDFEDPTDWADDRVMSREMAKLEACDMVLANMWKESIGTTLGIVRARHQGKPVVVVDPNRIHNAILMRLVGEEDYFHTLEDACARLRETARGFKDFVVRKRDGDEEAFSVSKLVQSVSLAAAKAGVSDQVFEQQITGPVIARVRRDGGRHGLVETADIRRAVFEQLDFMGDDPGRPIELRSRAQAVLEAWRRREDVKGAERSSEEARQKIASLEAERLELLKELDQRAARIAALERDRGAKSPAPPKNLVEALHRLQEEFPRCIVVHDKAYDSAKDSPYRDIGRAWEGLRLLGQCAGERQIAQVTGGKTFAGASEWLRRHLTEVSGVEYAAKESETVGGMFREERSAVYEGVELYGEQHLCLGDSFDPQHCLRVHFATHEDKIVVTWCGRHLRNTRS